MIQNPIVNHHIYQRNGQLHCKARPRSDLAKESAYCKVPPTITMYVPSVALFYGKWYRFLRFLLFLNEQVEKYGKMTSMIKIDLEPQSSAQMEPIHSVRAGIFSAGCVTLHQPSVHHFKFLTIEMLKAQRLDGLMNYDELWWIIWLESGPKLVPMAIHQRSSLQRLSRSRICSSLRESSQYFSNKR